MSEQYALLNRIQDEVTRRCGPCVVAGGCIRDTLMGNTPKDYDVFVFNNAQPIPDQAFNGLEIIKSPEWHKSEPHLQSTFRFEGVIVQVMASECTSLESLVATFDWNVSAFGYSQHRKDPVYAIGNVKDIGSTKKLKLLCCTYPVSTLRRGFRFSERFGMSFDTSELAELCAMASGRLLESKHGVVRK